MGGFSGCEGSGGVIVVAYRIGRGTANDIVVEDSSVSRCHAELRVADDNCVLVDLGSTNGTCVRENGRWIEIEKASVAPDERILLGEVVTTVTALIEKRDHEPKSLGVRSAPANEFTTPGRGTRGEAPPERAVASEAGQQANDHARLIGRRGRPAPDRPDSVSRRRDPAQKCEPEPPSREPIVYSGIAARLNGTPDAGPNRPDPSLRVGRAAATPAPSDPARGNRAAEGKPRSTPYLQVPSFAAGRRPGDRSGPAAAASDLAAQSDLPTPVRLPRGNRPMWLTAAAVGGLLVISAVVAAMQYGGALAGILGFTEHTRAQVIAASPPPADTPAPKTPAMQAEKRSWQQFVGGPGDDALSAGARYRDGGTILVGTTTAGLPASADLWAVRLDADGKVLWRRAFGTAKAEHGLAVAPARDGGALVAGTAEDRTVAWMLRLDSTGQKKWEHKVKLGARSFVSAATATSDGGFAVLVVGRDTAAGPARTELVRLDMAGQELWRRPLQREGIQGTDLLSVRDSGFAVAGVHQGDGTTLWVARLDPEGRISWARTLSRSGNDSRAYLRLARRDDLIVATSHLPEGQRTTGNVLRLVRLDRQGEKMWDHTVQARSDLQVNGLFLVKRGIIVAGVEQGQTPWVARIDTDGALVWERRFEALRSGRADTIVERGRGRMLVAGRIGRDGTRKQDGLLLFLDRAGRPEE